MKKIYTTALAFILSTILISYAFSQEPQKSYWSHRFGPNFLNQSYNIIYLQEICFIWTYHEFRNWRNTQELGRYCQDFIKDYIRNNRFTHSVEDWRHTSLPKDNRNILILGYFNKTQKGLGWVVVKNHYDGLFIYSGSHNTNWILLKDYPGSEASFKWKMNNGAMIEIAVRDPNNINGWAEDDIWYKFSYK